MILKLNMAVQYQKFRSIENDKGFISKDSISATLPQPNYTRGIYEFLWYNVN